MITGATGNVGQAVIRQLFALGTQNQIIAGVRDSGKAKAIFPGHPRLGYVNFDFESEKTFLPALENVDCVFLLRPPHISDTGRYFRPLISQLKLSKVKQVLFLSVQGAETSRVIPHHRIEDLIVASGLEYVFLRPSYFMQNLTTTLLGDIKTRREVFLPAGSAKFNWIDVENIGEAAAILLERFDAYKKTAIEITGEGNENFESVVRQVNRTISGDIKYIDANPIQYFSRKRREGIPWGLALVMFSLHYLPRFRKEPRISDFFEKLTGRKPTPLGDFLERERTKFEP